MALRRFEIAVEADLAPELFEPGAGALRPALQPAIDHDDGVHRAGARARQRLEAEPPVLDEGIEDAPGEGAVGPPPWSASATVFSTFGPTRVWPLKGDGASAESFGHRGGRVVRLGAVGCSLIAVSCLGIGDPLRFSKLERCGRGATGLFAMQQIGRETGRRPLRFPGMPVVLSAAPVSCRPQDA